MKLCRGGVSRLANGAPLLEGHRREGRNAHRHRGQQAFGKAVLEAFMARGDEVAGAALERPGTRPDPLAMLMSRYLFANVSSLRSESAIGR
jgi:hypothetical protein